MIRRVDYRRRVAVLSDRCARCRRRVPAMAAGAVAGRRSSLASPARHSTPRSAGSNPIYRCPISPFPAGRKSSRSSRNSCRRRRNICASRLSIASPRRASKLADAISRYAGAHREGVRRARQRGAGDLGARDRLRRLDAAARRASACWRRRPISASARISSATNSCTR